MIGSKEEMIIEYCKGRDILDIGCVQLYSEFSPENLKKTLHYKIHQAAKRSIGIDLEENGVIGLNEIGCKCYTSYAEDVHNLDIGKFDIIFLGDIIEHIPDPSTFLQNLRDKLKPDGLIICTTPNALSYSNVLFIIFNKQLSRNKHSAWYCKITLQNLFRLSGYSLVKMHFCNFCKTADNPIRRIMDFIASKVREELSPHLFGVFRVSESYDQREIQKKRIFHE